MNGVDILPDIKRTFDSINHSILLNKTNQRLGFIDIEVKWFELYMTNRLGKNNALSMTGYHVRK